MNQLVDSASNHRKPLAGDLVLSLPTSATHHKHTFSMRDACFATPNTTHLFPFTLVSAFMIILCAQRGLVMQVLQG
jgi:hypothetical protein